MTLTGTKTALLFSLLIAFSKPLMAQLIGIKPSFDIVPKPRLIEPSEGFIQVSGNFTITNEIATKEAEWALSEMLSRVLDDNANLDSAKTEIRLSIDNKNTSLEEGYNLVIDKSGIHISSSTDEGFIRAMATLEQLLWLNHNGGPWYLPECKIQDWAAFKHRGLLLDCSRHFFEVEVIKKYIDLLALYKMNVLHWHLTEDQGWRLAIDAYPKLTEIGAYRKELDGSTYGGYYTKEQIREVLAYAAGKHIEVIPEIEMPGHSQAAIASYPELSCVGEQVPVANDWGVFKEIYCAGNDSVFIFLETVLTEVFALFPSNRIHIGGDEAPKVRWEACDKCQKRIEEEGLANEAELQSYFIKRVERFLNENGKQLIGWDEILEGGLAEGATVQSWRGMEGGIEAVKHGNKAIMSPTSHAYFDYGLDAIDLEKVYSFNPIPDGLNEAEQQLIIGGECNIWTERVPNEATLDNRVFPRLLAMSEVLWSNEAERDFKAFASRVQAQYPILDSHNVSYGMESIPFTHQVEIREGKPILNLKAYSKSIELECIYVPEKGGRDTFTYAHGIEFLDACDYQIQAYKNQKPYGQPVTLPLAYHEGIDAHVVYEYAYNDWYKAGGEKALVDGQLGTLNFRDGAWQGFWGTDAVCTLQLTNPLTKVRSVSVNYYQYNNSWVFMPIDMTVEVSLDGETWQKIGSVKPTLTSETRGSHIETMQIDLLESITAAFVRVKAKNLGKVPDWHEAAGSDAWIFMDEIRVN